jgi:hypothetical protein
MDIGMSHGNWTDEEYEHARKTNAAWNAALKRALK